MKDSPARPSLFVTAKHERVYSTSILRASRHFQGVRGSVKVLDLVDELQRQPETIVVAVLDAADRVQGILRRDSLFALVGKPFGRDVLIRTTVAEIAEQVPVINSHAELFGVAETLLHGEGEPGSDFFPLVDDDGVFLGVLGSQDLANYLSRMTSEDIRLAGQLQDRLMAGKELAGGMGWVTEAWSRSAKGVGGDFYFTRTLPDGRAFFALCDVSGKGVAASLIVAMVWGMLQMYDFARGLEELILRINESVIATFHLEKYLTGIFMTYDPATKKLAAADMGHSHAFVLRGKRAHPLKGKQPNLPVGIEHDITPMIYTWQLKTGDRLIVYSDGITEQENPQGEEFGEKRFVRLASAALTQGEGLAHRIQEEVDAWRQRTPQQDDMTFMALAIDENS